MDDNELHAWDGKHFSSLPDKQQGAVYKYIGAFYSDINSHLRGTRNLHPNDVDVYITPHLPHLDKAIRNSRTPKEFDLYRGIAAPVDELHTVFGNAPRVGMEFRDPGYFSMSRSAQIARMHAGGSSRPGAFMHLKIPANSRALLTPKQYKGSEQEVILPRNSKLRISGVQRHQLSAPFESEHSYEIHLQHLGTGK